MEPTVTISMNDYLIMKEKCEAADAMARKCLNGAMPTHEEIQEVLRLNPVHLSLKTFFAVDDKPRKMMERAVIEMIGEAAQSLRRGAA